jgi:hypothetical protein
LRRALLKVLSPLKLLHLAMHVLGCRTVPKNKVTLFKSLY